MVNFTDFKPTTDILNNKKIVLTGATSQPGRALAIACCRAGASVVLIDSNENHLNKLYDQLADQAKVEPAIMPIDLSELNPHSSECLTKTLEQEYTSLDALVHCTLWIASLTPLELLDLDSWWQTLENQLVSSWLLTKALLPILKKSSSARVIFTTHSSGRSGKAYWGVIGAAFAAIENMVQTWNDEFETETVNFFTIDPGQVKTEWRSTLYPAENMQKLKLADDPALINHYLYLLRSDNAINENRQHTVSYNNS